MYKALHEFTELQNLSDPWDERVDIANIVSVLKIGQWFRNNYGKSVKKLHFCLILVKCHHSQNAHMGAAIFDVSTLPHRISKM